MGLQARGDQLKEAHFQTLLQLEVVDMLSLRLSPLHFFSFLLDPGVHG